MRWERALLPQAQETEQGREEADGSTKRWGHTCNTIKGGRFLYVFGGFGKDNCQTNRLLVFDSVEQTWSQPTIKGTPPAPRDGHSCTNFGDNLFVFGGTDGMNPLGDLHILDTSSHTWISPITRGETPEARQGHSAALVGKRLFIFGGYGKSPDDDDEVYFNDLFILNTETCAWKKAMTTGIPPSPRLTHGCSTWKNKMIVIGGLDGRDHYLSDVHILNADTLTWKELNATGHIPPPRAGYLTVTSGKILFVYGGYTEAQKLCDDLYMLDVESAIWSKVTTAGAGPSARFSMAGVCLDPVRSGVIAFVGGCNRSLEALDDIYYLHTGLAREHERRLEKLPLRKKLKLKCQEQNLTLGHDQALVQVGVSTSSYQPGPLSIYGQPGPPGSQSYPYKQSVPVQGKPIFQGRVMENFGDPYTIETVIDGKPLRGLLFSTKRGTLPIPFSSSSSWKRTYGDSSAGTPDGEYNRESNASRSIQPDPVADGQADAMHGEEASSQEPHAEPAGAVPVSDMRGHQSKMKETFVWKKAMTTGIPPSPRLTHSCSTWKNKIIVIGGQDGRDYYLSDVHILDADTLMWKELNTTGDMLPRRGGRLTVTFGKILFVYGGYTEAQRLFDDLYMLDVESAIWSKVTTAGAGPSARFSMAGVCLDPVRSGVLAFVGGCNRSLEALDDIYYLHTGLTREHKQRLEKLPLRKKLKLKCQEQNLTVGHDKALVQVGVSTSSYQPVPLSISGQPGSHSYPFTQSEAVRGKSIFQARVTENFGNQYAIETVIDGKHLRGILFFNEPSTLPIPFSSSSRNRTYGDSSTGIGNGDYNNESKASRSIQLESVDDGQADDVHGKEASSQEPHAEPAGPVAVSNVTHRSLRTDLDKDGGH